MRIISARSARQRASTPDPRGAPRGPRVLRGRGGLAGLLLDRPRRVLQRRGRNQTFVGQDGPQIGEDIERFAECEQAFFRAIGRRTVVELGESDRAEESSIGFERQLLCFLGKGSAGLVHGHAA